MIGPQSTFGPSADRPLELPFEEHHQIAEECVNKLGGRVRHCFRSAFEHLRRAWTLHPVDSEMSLFRAITAEEEAASALIFALKQKGYEGAEKLKPRDHTHKAAVSPFLDAVNNLLYETGVPTPRLSIHRGERPKIMITVDLAALLKKDEPAFAEIDQPFNYMLKKGESQTAYSFEQELQGLAEVRGEKSIKALVEREANLRNRLLYASDEGIPNVDFNDSIIINRRDRVYRISLITIGIMQTSQRQLFAVQCLRAYSAVLGHSVADSFNYQQISQPEGVRVNIAQQPDGSYTETISYRKSVPIEIGWQWLQEWRVDLNVSNPSSDASSKTSSTTATSSPTG